MRPLPGKTREEKTLKSAPRFFSLVVIASVYFFDRFLKIWIISSFPEEASTAVWEPFFYLTRVNNTGAAFGLWRNAGTFLTLFSALSIFLILLYLLGVLKLPAHRPLSNPAPNTIAWALVAGGALGNLVDRIRYGYVVDYLDFRIWPVFNLADACITIGVGWIVIRQLIHKRVER